MEPHHAHYPAQPPHYLSAAALGAGGRVTPSSSGPGGKMISSPGVSPGLATPLGGAGGGGGNGNAPPRSVVRFGGSEPKWLRSRCALQAPRFPGRLTPGPSNSGSHPDSGRR